MNACELFALQKPLLLYDQQALFQVSGTDSPLYFHFRYYRPHMQNITRGKVWIINKNIFNESQVVNCSTGTCKSL